MIIDAFTRTCSRILSTARSATMGLALVLASPVIAASQDASPDLPAGGGMMRVTLASTDFDATHALFGPGLFLLVAVGVLLALYSFVRGDKNGKLGILMLFSVTYALGAHLTAADEVPAITAGGQVGGGQKAVTIASSLGNVADLMMGPGMYLLMIVGALALTFGLLRKIKEFSIGGGGVLAVACILKLIFISRA